MRRFVADDRVAFGELYARHYEAVLRTCLRILGTRPVAADVAHDTFVTAYERRAQWRPQPGAHTVRAWFTTIATRKCLDLTRKASTRRERPSAKVIDVPFVPEIADHGVRTALRTAIAQLPVEQRQIIHLKVDCGLTYREISEHTGVPEPALKSRFRLARVKLARHLATSGITKEELMN